MPQCNSHSTERSEDFDVSIGDTRPASMELVNCQQTRERLYPATNHDQFRPSCTVVICRRDRPDQLDRCLEAVMQLDYPPFDVLVVDNAPRNNQSREVAMRWGARYEVETRIGLSRARNYGAQACATEIVAFLDDDSFPDAGWLGSLAEPFKDPLVMAVTGLIVAPNMGTQAQYRSTSMCGSNAKGLLESVFNREIPFWFERANFGGIGDGGNMAFRRCVFDIWPGFDERLGRGAIIDGGEEHNAFFSLLERGHRITRANTAVVYHPGPKNEAELRARQSRNLASASAYTLLMFVEHPIHRPAIIKYAIETLCGTTRSWRLPTVTPRCHVVSRVQCLLRLLYGPLLYCRSLLGQNGITKPRRIALAQKVVRYARRTDEGVAVSGR